MEVPTLCKGINVGFTALHAAPQEIILSMAALQLQSSYCWAWSSFLGSGANSSAFDMA